MALTAIGSRDAEEAEDSCDEQVGAVSNSKGVGVPVAWQRRNKMGKWNSMEPWEQEVEKELPDFGQK